MKKVLIVVDYQRDFVAGVMGNPAAQALESRLCRKIERYFAAGDDVVFTMDTHTPEDRRTREFQDGQRLHCLAETPGWQVYGKVAQYVPKATVICKNTYGSIALADVLREKEYDVVELVGVTTHACVLSNAIIAAAAKPFAEIVVDPACTASADEGQKQAALWTLAGLHIQVRSDDEFQVPATDAG